MKQTYHSNAATNIRLRKEIKESQATNAELAERFGVSVHTVRKWKNRERFTDKSSRPKQIHYSLSEFEQSLLVELRKRTWFSLDEICEAFSDNPTAIRSAVYRTFKRHGVNKKPEEQKRKAKKFKEYEQGFIHMDVTYLPKFDGQKYYLFVAIDRATRTLFFQVYENKTAASAEDFLKNAIAFFPFKITHILTDNGLEFTNRLIKSKKGECKAKDGKFDLLCQQEEIEHRLTKPFTPQTNGMVEKANDTIKSNTIKATAYQNPEQMNKALLNFLINYNLYRRHGGLRKELKVKTPIDALGYWYELNPDSFTKTPEQFKQDLLSLKHVKPIQPCET